MKSFDDHFVDTSQDNDDNFVIATHNSSESENIDEDPLKSVETSVSETKYYKLDKVVFAEPIEDVQANSIENPDPCEDIGEIAFVDNVMVKTRAGKRNRYFIDIKDGSLDCPVSTCSQIFSSTTLLKAHVRKVHCATTKCVCEECGACFTAAYLLRRHSAVHSGTKVQCNVCGKWLSARTDLSVHLRTHGASRPHGCSLCHKRFLRLSSLRTHVKFVHRDGDIPCGVCDARAEKSRSWDEVYANVVPGYAALGSAEKFAAGKEVQKRWRSIRDSYTKAYRQGKCVPAEQCAPGSRRYQYHAQMSFLLRALKNKKPRYSQDKYESFSELSNSSQHQIPDEMPVPNETTDKPLDLKTKREPEKPETKAPETRDKGNQATIEPKLEIKIDANSILPDDHFDDDKLFMNSLLPLFKKMDDDTRLLCRIEVLKIIRYALKGNKCFETLRMAEDSFFQNRISRILAKEEVVEPVNPKSTLSMTTRSADGSRPVRKRKTRSPSPQPIPAKRRGPGRPRKVRPPPSDSDEEQLSKKRPTNLLSSLEASRMTEMEESLSKATSVAQLSTPLFMKIYNLERSKPTLPQPNLQVAIKTEPVDDPQTI